jgi:AhpD family alkylhydroperoxidase
MGTMSRFRIHDEESAPAGSQPILKNAVRNGGQLPNFLGVLGGAPAALRAYVRFRTELRHGHLPAQTLERIALAVAAQHHSEPDITLHTRAAREAGVGLDDIRRARAWDSADPRDAALLRWLRPLVEREGGAPPLHVHEAALEAGWTEEDLIEAVAVAALETFQAMLDVAGDVPVDGSTEAARGLRAVA